MCIFSFDSKNSNSKLIFKLMNLTKFILFFLFIFSFKNYTIAQKYERKEGVEKDLRALITLFEKYHPGIYFYQSKSDLEYKYHKIEQNLTDSLTPYQSYNAIYQAVAEINDLHTSVGLPKKIKAKNPKLFPFILKRFGNDFFVHYNLSSDTTIIRTCQIKSINGEPIYNVYLKMQQLYGTDNSNAVSKIYYAEKAFGNYYNTLYGQKDSLKISLKIHPDSLEITKTIATVTVKDLNLTLKNRYKNATRSNMSYKVLDSLNHIAKLDITSFSYKANKLDISERKFKKTIKLKFKEIEKYKIEHLILDLRANGGGYIPNVGRLTKYIANEPFKLIDSMYFKPKTFKKIFPFYTIFPPLVGKILFKKGSDGNFYLNKFRKRPIKLSKKHRFKNNLYILMDGGSYSATTFTIGLMRDMQRATFIGTRPGGANWGSFAGSWQIFTLPNTKMRVRIPLYKIVHAQKNKIVSDFFVEPDYYVESNFEDFKSRSDSQLKFTLNLIKTKK